jgi:4-hydroxyphenylacetate 3-monooxygenase
VSNRCPISGAGRSASYSPIWDFLGSEFGSRHQQYEKFYGGASFLVKQNVFRNLAAREGAGRSRAQTSDN